MYLYKKGAMFTWIYGKEKANGTQKKISKIQFRKLSSWKKKDIERIKESGQNRAREIAKATSER